MSVDRARLVAGMLALVALGARAQVVDALGVFDDPLHAAPVDAPSCDVHVPDRLPADTLALADAVDIALCASPQVREAWAAVRARSAALGQARAAWLPTLQGSASRLRSVTSYPGADVPVQAQTGTALYAALTWRLFDFGERAAVADVARLDLAAALASRDASTQGLLDAVTRAYFAATGARATRDAQDAAVLLARSTLDSARRRVQGGAAGQGDELQATAALAKAELARSRAQGELDKAMADLAATVGVGQGGTASVPPVREPDAATRLATDEALDDWLADAGQRHPALAAARLQLQSARRSVDAATAQGLPTLDLAANEYRNGYPGQGLQQGRSHVATVGVTLTIPLFDGFARTYRMQAARAQVAQSEAQLQDARVQVLREVAKAYVDARTSRDDLDHSRTLVDAAQLSQQSASRRYDHGVGDIAELLSTQQALADALRERAQCLADWASAHLRLLASAGALRSADLEGRP